MELVFLFLVNTLEELAVLVVEPEPHKQQQTVEVVGEVAVEEAAVLLLADLTLVLVVVVETVMSQYFVTNKRRKL
jgi:hypothetical protein